MGRLVIDGNSVYEIDEECVRRKENQEKKRESRRGKRPEVPWLRRERK